MSDASMPAPDGAWGRLPAWLRPRAVELDSGEGGSNISSVRLIESTLLVLAAVLLTLATVNDLGRSVSVNHRLVADLRTWRHYTRHDYHNISIDQQTLGLDTQREVLCGNTVPGAPETRTQICLAIWGPVVNGRRDVHGGWYLPPRSVDLPRNRYGCFGPAAVGLCRR
jgi:hypothetical protein